MRFAILSTIVPIFGNFLAVSAVGDFGPDTCLQGYVWREAYGPNDHVCVTPATRSQAASDNAQAPNRRKPDGFCIQGYVWREANPSDHVCVTPAVRTQTMNDNAQAANRKASLKIWLTKWFPQPICHDGVCQITSDSDIPRYKVNGDHFNLASVSCYIRRNDNSLVWSETFNAAYHPGYIAGSFGRQANVIDCSGFQGSKDNGYAICYDSISNRWSAKQNVRIGCTVL